jgi:hypothetical protein
MDGDEGGTRRPKRARAESCRFPKLPDRVGVGPTHPPTQPPKLTRRRRAKTVAMAPHFFGMFALAAIILAINRWRERRLGRPF